MFVRTQSEKRLIACIGFELCTQAFGDEMLMDIVIYGITPSPNVAYAKVALGTYDINNAKEVMNDIEKALVNKQQVYKMPKKKLKGEK